MPNPYQHSSDHELLSLFTKSQNKEAFAELFERYHQLIVSVCVKYLEQYEEAKDMAMQVFEKCFQNIHKYEVNNFAAYLYTSAKNECLMKLRAGKDKIVLSENIHHLAVESEDTVHLSIEKEEQLNKMHLAIDLLPVEQQLCIRLFYLEKKSYAEIQAQTGYSFMQVKSYIQNAKRNLKIKLSHIE